MKYYIVIPAHNEAKFITLTLQSLVAQTIVPTKIVIVDDHSTDETAAIIAAFATTNPSISIVKNISDEAHLPGSKVIRAFKKGLDTLDDDYDFIVKADADLIFPSTYFETIIEIFHKNEKAGMAGGFAYIEKNDTWILENLTDKDHIRGAFKSYRKKCFQDIGGLKPAMGWDTADELLAKYYGWEVITDANLQVKHLKPTGANYEKSARYKQGEAFYTLGYGFLITAIAATKLAFMKRKPALIIDYLEGFRRAKKSKKLLLVSKEQAKFIRQYRFKKMISKIF